MSGYVQVKSQPKPGGFPSLKSWRKQWCILRPSHQNRSVAMMLQSSVSTAQIEIPERASVRRCGGGRAATGGRRFAFSVYASPDAAKPLVTLAGQSESEAQMWILRIRLMLRGKTIAEMKKLQEHRYNVSLIDNDYSNLCGFQGLFGVLTVIGGGFMITDGYFKNRNIFFDRSHISSIEFSKENEKSLDNERIVIIKINRNFEFGEGKLHFFCINAKVLLEDFESTLKSDTMLNKLKKRLSKSDETIFELHKNSPTNLEWYYRLEDNVYVTQASNNQREIKRGTISSEDITNRTNRKKYSPSTCGISPCNRRSSLTSFDEAKSETSEAEYFEIEYRESENIYEEIDDFYYEIDETKTDSKNDNLFHTAFGAFRNRIKSEPQISQSTNYKKYSKDRKGKLSPQMEVKSSSKFYGSPVLNRILKNAENKNVIENAKQRTMSSTVDLKSGKYSKNRLSKSEETLNHIDYKKYGFYFENNDNFATKFAENVGNEKMKLFDNLDSQDQQSSSNSAAESKVHYYGFHFPEKEYKFDNVVDWQCNTTDEGIKDLSLLSPENSFVNQYPQEIVDLVLRGKASLAEKKLRQMNEGEYVEMCHSPKKNQNYPVNEELYLQMN